MVCNHDHTPEPFKHRRLKWWEFWHLRLFSLNYCCKQKKEWHLALNETGGPDRGDTFMLCTCCRRWSRTGDYNFGPLPADEVDLS